VARRYEHGIPSNCNVTTSLAVLNHHDHNLADNMAYVQVEADDVCTPAPFLLVNKFTTSTATTRRRPRRSPIQMYASHLRAYSFNLAGVLIPCFVVAFLGADGGAIGASSQAKSPGVGNADRGVYSSYAAAHNTKQVHKKDISPTNRTSQKARPDSGRWNTTSPTLTWTPKPCVLLPSLL